VGTLAGWFGLPLVLGLVAAGGLLVAGGSRLLRRLPAPRDSNLIV
jgi:hypothetical protein